uniref:(northern house mosquito) hypothetical protein n=1 Tax=Culex pipiens TaxID=7175 RepID=A0A8D8BFZ1_CULPI
MNCWYCKFFFPLRRKATLILIVPRFLGSFLGGIYFFIVAFAGTLDASLQSPTDSRSDRRPAFGSNTVYHGNRSLIMLCGSVELVPLEGWRENWRRFCYLILGHKSSA